MLNITCTVCRSPINLSDGDLALIMDEVGDKPPKSYLVNCPRCRRGNKLPMRRIEQAYRLAGSPPVPVPSPVEPPPEEPPNS